MAGNVKPVPMHKRLASGENVTGLKHGGAVRKPAAKKKGGMTKGKKC